MNMNEEKMAEFLTDGLMKTTFLTDGLNRTINGNKTDRELTKGFFEELFQTKTIVSGQGLKEYLEKKLVASVRGAGTQEADVLLMDVLEDLFGLHYRVVYGEMGQPTREPELYRVEMETQLL